MLCSIFLGGSLFKCARGPVYLWVGCCYGEEYRCQWLKCMLYPSLPPSLVLCQSFAVVLSILSLLLRSISHFHNLFSVQFPTLDMVHVIHSPPSLSLSPTSNSILYSTSHYLSLSSVQFLTISLSFTFTLSLTLTITVSLYLLLSVCLCLCLCLSVYLSVCQSVCLSICLSVCLSLSLSLSLSIYL